MKRISLDKRKIRSFEMSSLPDVARKTETEILLRHQHLSDIAKLDIHGCKITLDFTLPFLGHLRELDLSGNDIETEVNLFEDHLAKFTHSKPARH